MRNPTAYDGSQLSVRLGSAEVAILAELRRAGEPVPRQLLLLLVHAQTSRSGHAASSPAQAGVAQLLPSGRARQNVESTVSRALRSLERKGLIVRSFSGSTRQTLISAPTPPVGPRWERVAIEEEAFAARCDAVAAELAELARNARTRASQLGVEQGPTPAFIDRPRRHASHVPVTASA